MRFSCLPKYQIWDYIKELSFLRFRALQWTPFAFINLVTLVTLVVVFFRQRTHNIPSVLAHLNTWLMVLSIAFALANLPKHKIRQKGQLVSKNFASKTNIIRQKSQHLCKKEKFEKHTSRDALFCLRCVSHSRLVPASLNGEYYYFGREFATNVNNSQVSHTKNPASPARCFSN